MDGDEVGGGRGSRDGAFCFGTENSMPSLSQAGLNSLGLQGFGFDQPSQRVNPLAPTGYFPQSGPYLNSSFTMGSDFFGSRFSYDNISSIPNSTSNMNRLVGFPNMVPSNSNSFPIQTERFPPSMTDNFYSASGLPCNSLGLLTTSQHALLPTSGSSANFIKNDHSDFEDTNNLEGHICDMSTKSIPSWENSTLEMLQISRQLLIHPTAEEFDEDLKDSDLKLIIQKELSNSDVGTVGRIVLPKKEAEANLPPLTEREGIILEMDDIVLSVTWKFKYRYWPNNKSRMYIMESTGDFVKAHGLQTGDYFIIYRSSATENYVVRGTKGVRPPTRVEGLHCDCGNDCRMNADFSHRLPMDKYESGDSRQQWLEKGTSLGQTSSSSTSENAIHTYGVDTLNTLGRSNTEFHHFSQTGIVSDNESLRGLVP